MLASFEAPAIPDRLELKDADAVMLGKTNMDEFAMRSSNETSHSARYNPGTPARPGGSSGGSAAAVAAGLCVAATGTDTGGSIRRPAALTGITGLSHLRLVFALGHGGVCVVARPGRSDGAERGGRRHHVGGHVRVDGRDSTSAQRPVADYAAALSNDIRGMRIGLVREFMGDGVDPGVADSVRAAITELENSVQDRRCRSAQCRAVCACLLRRRAGRVLFNLARFDGVRYGHRCEVPRT